MAFLHCTPPSLLLPSPPFFLPPPPAAPRCSTALSPSSPPFHPTRLRISLQVSIPELLKDFTHVLLF
ncbi:hypothetical protein OsI_19529 [Oryza sativa Indica Group]|uniref:Uncharacterized protein n=1 Tax=Oryza sativa subsp. indica TaxID=39946 RepID=A2Y3E3_ORYSI|nr:hypothetical protein OsI_19529 [Oryza sativa Indica Group]